MSQRLALVVSSFVVMLAGCTTPQPPKYTRETVLTYAELLAFYEREKMLSFEQDSTYRRKLKNFFAERSIDEGEFKNRIGALSRDYGTWKVFLVEATAAEDSIRVVTSSQNRR